MNKQTAIQIFKQEYLPHIPKNDKPAKRLEWNTFVDQLQKNGEITRRQAETWDQPAFIKN